MLLFELVYTSTARSEPVEIDILSIQNKLKMLYLKRSLTGCLILHNCKFVGILEGKEKYVREQFLKIKKDNFFEVVKPHASGSIAQRCFEKWNMVFQISDSDVINNANEQLFRHNLIGLSQFAIKPTYPSRIFWHKVRELLEEG